MLESSLLELELKTIIMMMRYEKGKGNDYGET